MASGEQLRAFFTLIPCQMPAVSQVCPPPSLPCCTQLDPTPPRSVDLTAPLLPLHTQLRTRLAALYRTLQCSSPVSSVGWEAKGGQLWHWEVRVHTQTQRTQLTVTTSLLQQQLL